jgi:hypothetical protein
MDMGGLGLRRPTSNPHRDDRRAATLPTLVVLIVTAALVATCGGPAPSPTAGAASPAAPAASGSVPASPGVGAGPEPTPPPGEWAAVDLPPLARVATLEATRSGTAGVALDTAFRLTALEGRDPAELASRLVVEPSVRLTAGKASGDTVVLTPAKPLVAGQLYRFSVRGAASGTTEATWAVQAAKPLHVVTSIPYDEATDVPRDTGIEITFDQAGVSLAAAERHIDISPDTAGRFELHGRTVAFVPDRPLRQARLYTVTVREGLPLAGTGMRLERDVVLRFETAGNDPAKVRVHLNRPLYDASTKEQAAIGLDVYREDDDDEEGATGAAENVSVKVHRLPSLEAAIRAYDAIHAIPDWTALSAAAPVRTSGLPRVLSGTLRVRDSDSGSWIQLPRALRAGWYVVTVTLAGIPHQAVLQVSDLAAYGMVSTNRTAVWVNDLRTTGPARGISVSIEGRALGRTGADGLLVARTPAVVVRRADDGRDMRLIVRAGRRTTFVPVHLGGVCEKCGNWDTGEGYGVSDHDRWWQVFTSDRYRYRPTDTVNLWGVVRDRAGGAAPAKVTLEMLVQDWSASSEVPVARTTATPDRTGSFIARLAFADLPAGDYTLRLRASGDTVADISIAVGSIVKPAWELSVETDRHAVISGQSVEASLQASFFEGTPVAGAEIRLGGESEGDEEDGGARPPIVVRTDADGAAIAVVPMAIGDDDDEEGVPAQHQVEWIYAQPTAPEEGEIASSTEVAVFAASALVSVRGTVGGTRLAIDGSVNDVAFERYEAAGLDGPWDVDPVGDPRAGASVRVRVVEHITTVLKVGTSYDFITKRVEPVYETSVREKDLGTTVVRTAADGTFHLERTVTGGSRRSYSVVATYVDEAGRTTAERADAESATAETDDSSLWLETPDGVERAYGVGATVRVVARGGTEGVPASRYLFLVSRQGLRGATVSDGRKFATRFDAADVPTLWIDAVRFTGTAYEVAGWSFRAEFRSEDRRLAVELTPDRARYAPGERATLAIRTTGPDGRPVAASVYVRVIDERLYAMGAAGDADPLPELYASVGTGQLATARSHQPPLEGGGEGGDTTGGGGDERSDFRDWLAAEIVRTGADGRGSLLVNLSDDLTSWRAVGQAVDGKLRAGIGTAPIAVSLPLFAEANVAPEYLAADRPIIRVRAYGTGLRVGDRVTFRVSSDTLPMAAVTVTGRAFEAIEVPLPGLSVGEHRVRIVASAGSGSGAREDVLVRSFRVVETRTVQGRTTWAPLVAATGIEGGPGLTTVTLVDAGRGRVVPLLESLAWAQPDRADRAIAAAVATALLQEAFGIEPAAAVPDPQLDRFQASDGVSIVPWADAELELSVLAAMSGDPRVNRAQLHQYFAGATEDEDGDGLAEETRERALWRLAGQAAIGEPVLADVRLAAKLADLEPAERLTLALAALAAGDEELAVTLERGLVEEHGQRLGPWVRIHGLKGVDDAVTTARLAIVAASVGDPIAADMDAYVEANPPRATLVDLERAIAARGWVARVPGAAAVAAVTIGGQRSEVRITPDRPARYALTPAQVEGARLEPVSGSVLVVTAGESPLVADALTPPSGTTVRRAVTPAGTIGATDTVVVTYRVNLGFEADDGCWRVTDFAPSGLVPIGAYGWYEESEDQPAEPAPVSPWRVEGQRVDFCVTRDPRSSMHQLRYLARVVTPGTYRWESTVLQSSLVPEQGIVLPPTEVTIAGMGS